MTRQSLRLVPVARDLPQHPPDRPCEVQGTLALDLGREEAPLPRGGVDRGSSSRLAGPGDAELRGWAARLAQAMVETVVGRRPVGQLAPWTSPAVLADLEERARVLQRAAEPGHRGVRPQVRSVHLSQPRPGAAEVSVHLRHGSRSRALAMRLERCESGWRCTALELG